MTDSELIMKQAKDAAESQKSLVTRIDHYIFQLSPHIKTRESARLLTESHDLLEHYESMLKRLGSKQSITLQILVGNVESKFDYTKEYFSRIAYANEEFK